MKECEARRATLVPGPAHETGGGLDRRAFLRRSGLIAGTLGTLGALPLGNVRKAAAGPPPAPGATVTRTKATISIASLRRSGVPTTSIIRRASVTPPPSPA